MFLRFLNHGFWQKCFNKFIHVLMRLVVSNVGVFPVEADVTGSLMSQLERVLLLSLKSSENEQSFFGFSNKGRIVPNV
jgi:hypothetical protein